MSRGLAGALAALLLLAGAGAPSVSLAAPVDETVYVVEGEKDVLTLAAAGVARVLRRAFSSSVALTIGLLELTGRARAMQEFSFKVFEAFAAAVGVFGRGQVTSYILAGLGDGDGLPTAVVAPLPAALRKQDLMRVAARLLAAMQASEMIV